MKKLLVIFLTAVLLSSCGNGQRQNIAKTPPMGWNSWDSYGLELNQKTAIANMDAFAEKLKPYGYRYFVIDAGWYTEGDTIHLNKYGLFEPSRKLFPQGFKPVIDHCHSLGLKFGLHLMRGIPRRAVKQNLPVKGTKYSAADIADTSSICSWSSLCYGIDMDKPGAQAYYNSLVKQLADWGIDFIKYDDIVSFPKEIEAVQKAVAQCGRPVLLSLSPGEVANIKYLNVYKKANMLRVTEDIWDTQRSIDKTFEAMHKWNGIHFPGFWIDMDMIPFGQLRLTAREKLSLEESALYAESGMGGPNRWSKLTKDQMFTLITQRAINASPLIIGGDLVSLDAFSLRLLTNKEMIGCDQNGEVGKLVYDSDSVEIWSTHQKNSQNKWVAVFNRTGKNKTIVLTPKMLNTENGTSVIDIWDKAALILNKEYSLAANGVLFLKLTSK